LILTRHNQHSNGKPFLSGRGLPPVSLPPNKSGQTHHPGKIPIPTGRLIQGLRNLQSIPPVIKGSKTMSEAEKPDPANSAPIPASDATKEGQADRQGAKKFASHYLQRYGQLCLIVHLGWDEAQQLHLFEGMIEPGCRGNYLHFNIHIRPTDSGGWEVASKRLG
jgi:hypothetical protein